MKIKLDPGAYMPERAHDTDAGLDLRSMQDETVYAHSSAVFDTGVHVQIPVGYAGILMSKSGLNVRHGITSEGVIDCGYTGSIVVKLYNDSPFDYQVKKGDKISQLLIMPVLIPSIHKVDTFEETERGNNGFGSSGR